MIIKTINYIIFVTFIITAVALFVIKNKVMNLSDEYAQINTQIAVEKKQIYLLRAEIAYLTSPAILKQYAASHKELQPIKVDQIIQDPACSKEYSIFDNIVERKSHEAVVKWRFKKGHNKYLQQAVMKK